jgi:hypothetical protein
MKTPTATTAISRCHQTAGGASGSSRTYPGGGETGSRVASGAVGG